MEERNLVWTKETTNDSAMCKFFEFLIEKTEIRKFCQKHNFCFLNSDGVYNYEAFHCWSVNYIEEFWRLFLDFSQIKLSQGYTKVLEQYTDMSSIPKWFVGSKLNYAQNVLRNKGDSIAVSSIGEGITEQHTTFSELEIEVKKFACILLDLGVKKGDVVASLLPNVTLSVVAMLATASIGAIWTCASPETQTMGIVMRIRQTSPKILLSFDQVVYNGKFFSQITKLQELVKEMPSLEHVIITTDISMSLSDISVVPKAVPLSELKKNVCPEKVVKFEYEQVAFAHPLFIMYSSGTTGIPKGLVHSVGGTLLQHVKDHMLHGSLTSKDVHFYYTITAWMMWNWLITSLYTGCRIVLYNGSPFYPDQGCLWNHIDKLKVTMLGAGAAYYQILENNEYMVKQNHDVSKLRTILSTGSVLPDHTYDFLVESIKNPLQVCSIAAATDIISCFGGVNPLVNVFRGQVQCRNLAMDIESWDPTGKPHLDTSGELVVKKPFPSMPVFLWNDVENKKYNDTYFSRYPGYWAQGDYCQIVSNSLGIIMLGRSDATLNPHGVRFGSAEIYSVVENMKEVDDTLCVGQYYNETDRVVLFIKMNSGYKFDESFVQEVKSEIRKHLSPRHVPALILEITDVPYTLTGKKIEIAVKKILSRQTFIIQRESLRNPEALDQFHVFVEKDLL